MFHLYYLKKNEMYMCLNLDDPEKKTHNLQSTNEVNNFRSYGGAGFSSEIKEVSGPRAVTALLSGTPGYLMSPCKRSSVDLVDDILLDLTKNHMVTSQKTQIKSTCQFSFS